MSQIIHAIYDGHVLHPEEPIELTPNTKVLITIEEQEKEQKEKKGYKFLSKAKSLNLEGPKDWSENIDQYLYGKEDDTK